MTEDQIVKLMFAVDASQLATATAALKGVNAAAVNAGTQWVNASAGAMHYNQSLARASGGVHSFNYRLQAMAHTFDDLQYVGEQGLRPILNNLTMISPALGMIVIAGNMVYKSWDQISGVVKGTFGYWTEGLDKSISGTSTLSTGIKGLAANLQSAGTETVKFFARVGEGFDALSGGIQAREKAAIAGLEGRKSEAEKERGAALKKSLGQFSGKEILASLTAQEDKIGPSPDKSNQRARLADLVKQAEAGDPNAIAGIRQRLKGTRIGSAIEGDLWKSKNEEDLKRRAEKAQEDQAIADEANAAIDRKRKAKADDLARAMGGRVGGAILANESLEDGSGSKLSGNDLARERIRAMRDRLLETGQAGSREEADAVAKMAYDQIWGETWKKLREKVNQGAANVRAAAAELVDEADTEERGRRRERDNRVRAAHDRATAAARGNLSGTLGAAADTMFGDDLTRRIFQAREQGVARRVRTPGQRRAFQRMTLEERLKVTQRENDATDRQAIAFQRGRILRAGITRDPAEAERLARAQVAQSRDRINGMTGDPGTKAAEQNTDATKALTQKIEELITKGVTPPDGTVSA